MEQVGVGHEGQSLLPGPVAGREVLGDIDLVTDQRLDVGHQLLLDQLGLAVGARGKCALLEQHLAAHDLVDPGLGNLELAQHVGELVDVARGAEVGRRSLQHRDVLAVVGHGRDQRRGGRARADHHDLLAAVVQVLRPGLRMDDPALVAVHAGPVGGVALVVLVIALAHPQETGAELEHLAGVAATHGEPPLALGAGPGCRDDLMPVADVSAELVLLDHLAHVAQDFLGGGDRCAGPGLETVAEGVELAVRAYAGVAVRDPGAAEAVLGFQHQVAGAGALGLEVVGSADAGDAGADDDDVKELRAVHLRIVRRCSAEDFKTWRPTTGVVRSRTAIRSSAHATHAVAGQVHRPPRAKLGPGLLGNARVVGRVGAPRSEARPRLASPHQADSAVHHLRAGVDPGARAARHQRQTR